MHKHVINPGLYANNAIGYKERAKKSVFEKEELVPVHAQLQKLNLGVSNAM